MAKLDSQNLWGIVLFVFQSQKHWNGLSPFGEKVIAELNKLGCFVDISHVSDSTFYDVMKLTKSPVIASHSSCRKFTHK